MSDSTPNPEDKRPGIIRNMAKAASESLGEAMGAARDKVTETAATVMGTTVEKTVTEYSELYTQVLLGLHKDLQTMQATVASMAAANTEAAALRTEVASLRKEVETLQRWRMLGIIAVVVAAIALSGVVWIAAS